MLFISCETPHWGKSLEGLRYKFLSVNIQSKICIWFLSLTLLGIAEDEKLQEMNHNFGCLRLSFGYRNEFSLWVIISFLSLPNTVIQHSCFNHLIFLFMNNKILIVRCFARQYTFYFIHLGSILHMRWFIQHIVICRWNYNYFPVTGVTTVCFCLWVFLQIIYLRIWNVAFCVSNCIIWTIVVFTCVTICLSISTYYCTVISECICIYWEILPKLTQCSLYMKHAFLVS